MKKYIYIIAFSAFLLFFTIDGSALTQLSSSFADEGAVPIKDSTSLLLIGMGLFGLAGVSRSKSKK